MITFPLVVNTQKLGRLELVAKVETESEMSFFRDGEFFGGLDNEGGGAFFPADEVDADEDGCMEVHDAIHAAAKAKCPSWFIQ